MKRMQVRDDVTYFRNLHRGERILALPNAWDAASAGLFRSAGAAAIATTSAGVAWAAGYPDGDALPQDELLDAVRSVCRAAGDVPVSADIEGGYSDEPAEVAELAALLRVQGVCGLNLEDGRGEPGLLARKIEAIKKTLRDRGGDIFINARTDVLLHNLASGGEAIRETISRVQLYERAGADGVFVPFLTDPDAVRAISAATSLPLNVLALPQLAPMHELYDCGVRRLSAGSALVKLALGEARRSALAFVRDDDIEALFSPSSLESSELNSLFT